MGVLYLPFFDVSEVTDLGTITLATAGKSNVVVNVAALAATAQDDASTSSIFAHSLGSGLLSYIFYPTGLSDVALRFPLYAKSSLAQALDAAITAEANAQSWNSTGLIAISFSLTTGLYTFAYSHATFSVTFSNTVTRNMFGFSGNQSGGTSYTGTKTPLYCINSTLPDVSDESDLYEPDGIGNHVIADDGAGYGISRTTAPLYKDWWQTHEVRWKVARTNGVQPDQTSHPFTHQNLFDHCRGEWPFILYGADRDGDMYGLPQIYSLRSDGISFKPERQVPGSGTQFKVPYRCVFEGTVGIAVI